MKICTYKISEGFFIKNFGKLGISTTTFFCSEHRVEGGRGPVTMSLNLMDLHILGLLHYIGVVHWYK